MEIHWGENLIIIEKTVAILIAATPLLAVYTLPKVLDLMKRIIYITRRKRESYLERVHKQGGG